MNIAIIGGGRLGGSLGRALSRRGFAIRAVCDRTAALAGRARRAVGAGRATTDPALAARAAEAVFLCLPDDALAGEARRLARAVRDWRGKTVFHCSGLLASEILAPLRERGAAVASFHPVQSFPKRGMEPDVFRGIFIGLEGGKAARALGRKIALRLGARPIVLRPAAKPLYHAACSLASNHGLILFHLAAGLMARTGMSRRTAERVLGPLAQGTLRNVKTFGSDKALTGPVLRGDIAAVRRHLEVLRADSSLRRVYKLLAREGLKIARDSSLEEKTARTLSRLLAGQ
ncbi:MAG: DUF2520 domain-containing protein [Candidatus Aminicenantes bacterium]|nr:DUF2520 domain-containing protein [Candidatus Aminicenantes bacterium]